MSRHFVLVTANAALTAGLVKSAAGIKKLKRGVSLHDFMQEYISKFNYNAETTILKRDDAYMVTRREPDRIFTWHFTEYDEVDILFAVRHLSRDELHRDLKELLPLRAA